MNSLRNLITALIHQVCVMGSQKERSETKRKEKHLKKSLPKTSQILWETLIHRSKALNKTKQDKQKITRRHRIIICWKPKTKNLESNKRKTTHVERATALGLAVDFLSIKVEARRHRMTYSLKDDKIASQKF